MNQRSNSISSFTQPFYQIKMEQFSRDWLNDHTAVASVMRQHSKTSEDWLEFVKGIGTDSSYFWSEAGWMLKIPKRYNDHERVTKPAVKYDKFVHQIALRSRVVPGSTFKVVRAGKHAGSTDYVFEDMGNTYIEKTPSELKDEINHVLAMRKKTMVAAVVKYQFDLN